MVKSKTLTPKAIRILDLVKEGHTDSEIASKLGIATGTVKGDLERIRAKLQARNRVDAVVKGLRGHYIELGG